MKPSYFGLLTVVLASFFTVAAPSAHADEVVCKSVGGDYSGSRNSVWGSGRQSCSFSHAKGGKLVEGWVRGWAKIDRSTDVVEIVEELETDSTQTGPCGAVDVELWGKGKLVATVTMGKDPGQDFCINGKPPGKAVAKVFTVDKTILQSEAAQVDEVRVKTEVTGTHVGPWGWNPNVDDVVKAIQVIAAVAAS